MIEISPAEVKDVVSALFVPPDLVSYGLKTP